MKNFWNNLGTGPKILLGTLILAIIVTIVWYTGVTPADQVTAIKDGLN